MGRKTMTTEEKVRLLKEALALEAAGSRWKQSHAAVIAGMSPSYLRNSMCPKRREKGHGKKGESTVFYVPPEVREWMAKREEASERA